MRPGLLRSSFATTAILGLRMLTQAGTLILVTRILGPSTYGDYVAAASMAMIAGLVPNLGAGYVLMARAAREGETAVETWRYAWPLSLCLGAGMTLLFPVVAGWLTRGSLSTANLFLIGIAELLVTPLTQLSGFVLQSRDRVAQGQVITWLPLLLRAIAAAACLLVFGTHDVDAFVGLQATGAVAGLLIGIVCLSRMVRLPWRPRRPTRDEWRSGSAYAAMHVVASNPGEIDKITAPILLGDHAAGIYSATSRIMNAVIAPLLGVLLAAQPRLFRQGAAPSREGHRLIVRLGASAAAWGAVSALGMALAAPLLPYLLGRAFADAAQLLPWVAIACPFIALRMTAGTVLVALGKPLQRLRFELGGIVLMACLLTLGTRLMGIHGMAWGLAGAEACMAAYGWLLVRSNVRLA